MCVIIGHSALGKYDGFVINLLTRDLEDWAPAPYSINKIAEFWHII